MSIAEDIIKSSSDEFSALDRIEQELYVRRMNGFTNSPEYAELLEARNDLDNEIADRYERYIDLRDDEPNDMLHKLGMDYYC